MVDTTSPTQSFTENGTFRSLPLLTFTWIMCLAKPNGMRARLVPKRVWLMGTMPQFQDFPRSGE
jgi:hypothetical protein